MTTVTGNQAAATETTPVSREVAMQHLAAGRTAQGRRALASVPLVVDAFAGQFGVSPETLRGAWLNLADAMDAVTDDDPAAAA